MRPFDLYVPLDAGPLMVQASAGTGKTWSIARLVARLLVEPSPDGGPPPTVRQVLVVTFTEPATAELRDRIRALIVLAAEAAERICRAVKAGIPAEAPAPSDGLDVLLGVRDGLTYRALDVAELAVRASRWRTAIADFDTAAISTIHGFCHRVLNELAFESGAPMGDELASDTRSLIDELLDDWFSSRIVDVDIDMYHWLIEPKAGGLDRRLLRAIAIAAIQSPEAALRPPPPTEAELLASRAGVEAFLAQVQTEFRPAWAAGRAELVAQVSAWFAGGLLHRGRYNAAQTEAYAAEIDAWLAGACAKPSAGFSLGAQKLSASVLKGKTLPTLPPLAIALDAWSQARGERTSLETPHFAQWIRTACAKRLRAAQQITFDDMLRRVRDGLRQGGEAGQAFLAALRNKFQAALIDEFQDTDAVQWEVFERVFCGSDRHRLVLIGDPKQAIYSFRGADITVYERARQRVTADRQFSMTRNFRSDARLLAAHDAMMGGRPSLFLTESIQYEPVQAAQPSSRLFDAAGAPLPPFVLRWLGGPAGAGQSGKTLTRQAMSDTAAQVAQLLASGATTRDATDAPVPIRARQVAVLVATHAAARFMRGRLLGQGVPAVLSQAGTVWDSEEAWWLQVWLEALADPTQAAALRALAATPLGGLSGALLLAVRDGEPAASRTWQHYTRAIQRQANRFSHAGAAAAFSELLQMATPAPEAEATNAPVTALLRLAAQPMGERLLTNLRHLAELLTAAQLAERLTADGLARWLRRQRSEAAEESAAPAEAAQLRLESDADAVVITTLHSSKGLQYPIVYLPDLMLDKPIAGKDPASRPFRFHPGDTDDADGQALQLVGLAAAPRPEATQAWREAQQERQRLLYVALTRAEWQVVAYAGPVQDNAMAGLGSRHFLRSPLGLLVQADSDHADRLSAAPVKLTERPFEVVEAFEARMRQICSASLCVVQHVDAAPSSLTLPARPPPAWRPLGQIVDFEPDDTWRAESYTGLIASRHGIRPDSEPISAVPPSLGERPGEDEDPDADADTHTDADGIARHALVVPSPTEPADPTLRLLPEVPLRRFPGGAKAGTWVHEILEHLHFQSDPPRPKVPELSLAELVRRYGARNGFADAQVTLPGSDGAPERRASIDRLLIDALPTMLQTPLGAAAGDLRLCDLADADRLDELAFDLPIGNLGGSSNVLGAHLAEALATRDDGFTLPGDYLAHLAQMGFRTLRGSLTGTMDLVFRAEVAGEQRFFVLDYKTNLLGLAEGGRVARSQPQHYSRPWLEAELARKHYYVQYLLYLTALHRFLGLRLRNYDYDRHIGGALYLFVRGMPGADVRAEDCAANTVPGVYWDRPPRAVIERLSAVLAGAATADREAT